MSSSVLYMSMSLDGYIAGPDDEPGNPGGDGFMRLHEWYFADGESGRPSGPAGELAGQMTATGAVLVGRSHRGTGRSLQRRSSRRADLRAQPPAAGERDVLVHGAEMVQRALEAGVLDEIQIHQIPVLLGTGRRLFGILPSRIELEIVRVIDTPQATHIRYRVRR
jgi:dihydrofolate reductase